MSTATTMPAEVAKLTDQDALWEMQCAVTEQLTRVLLGDLEQLLRPCIKAIRATGVWADFLIARAGTHEVTRQQPWPVRFDIDDLHVNWEPSGKLTVPDEARDEAEGILFQLTQLHGGLISGHDLPFRLPSRLY